MRTHVEFRSDKFPPYVGEEDQVNPNIWGKRLAEYLEITLRKQGIETEEIYSEDWGWSVPIKNDEFTMWIGCGHYQEYENGYLCFVEPSKPTIRKWFKKIDIRDRIENVTNALNSILTSDPEIHGVRWWTDEEKK